MLIAYNPATAAAVAKAFCKKRGFPSAGSTRSFQAPEASTTKVYDMAGNMVVTQRRPAVFSGIECVPRGSKACKPDARNNVGVGSKGQGNWGNRNSGSGACAVVQKGRARPAQMRARLHQRPTAHLPAVAGNVGSFNSGSGNIGDSNVGSGNVGHRNTKSGFVGTANKPRQLA